MGDWATIVHPAGRVGYIADVVSGSIESYYPSSSNRRWRPTARWAKAAGDRWIRRRLAADARRRRRERNARLTTGYDR